MTVYQSFLSFHSLLSLFLGYNKSDSLTHSNVTASVVMDTS